MKCRDRTSASLGRHTPISLTLALAALIVPGCALCASSAGTLSGTVVDPSGAVIPGVAVTLLCTETGVKQVATTNSEGSYLFPALPAGHYEIEIHHSNRIGR